MKKLSTEDVEIQRSVATNRLRRLHNALPGSYPRHLLSSLTFVFQECIKPVKVEKTASGTGARISIQEDGGYYQTESVSHIQRVCSVSYLEFLQDGASQKLQKVEITLSDCLACSGCITSAESVLVTQQSQEELLRVLRENAALKQA